MHRRYPRTRGLGGERLWGSAPACCSNADSCASLPRSRWASIVRESVLLAPSLTAMRAACYKLYRKPSQQLGCRNGFLSAWKQREMASAAKTTSCQLLWPDPKPQPGPLQPRNPSHQAGVLAFKTEAQGWRDRERLWTFCFPGGLFSVSEGAKRQSLLTSKQKENSEAHTG